MFLIPGFPKDEFDSECNSAIQEFVLELKNRPEVTITFIAFQYPYDSKTYVWNGITVHAIGGRIKKGFSRLLIWRKVYQKAKLIHRSQPIDQVHSFWLTECALVGNYLAKKFKVKHSCTLMGQDARKSNKYIQLFRKFPTLITLSRFHTSQLKQNFSIDAEHQIPWGVKSTNLTPPIKNDARDIDVLGVGNLVELKAFNKFIETIKQVKTSRPDIKAKIIGRGVEENNLRNFITENGLKDNIELFGSIPRDAVFEEMKQSKVLLHFSEYESFGMVLLEAQSFGVTVVSTPVGIAKELPAITIENPEDAAKRILEILQSEPSDAELLVKPEFQIANVADQYLNLVFM